LRAFASGGGFKMSKYMRITDEDGSWIEEDSEDYTDDPDVTVERDIAPTSDEIGRLLDADAESANWHDFVGFGEYLAALIAKEVDEPAAARVLRSIMDGGGFVDRDWSSAPELEAY
jgi:hypothetical protein